MHDILLGKGTSMYGGEVTVTETGIEVFEMNSGEAPRPAKVLRHAGYLQHPWRADRGGLRVMRWLEVI